MINWKEIKDLHVISKLEEIMSKWFNVELFFTDEVYKIQSTFVEDGKNWDNKLVNLQMHLKYGREFIHQDIEAITDKLQESDEKTIIFESCFPHIKGIASKIVIDGEYS